MNAILRRSIAAEAHVSQQNMTKAKFNARRPALVLIRTAADLLPLLVFLWGLQYRISLYAQHRPQSKQVVQARLLTDNERLGGATAAKTIAAAHPEPLFLATWTLAADVCRPGGATNRILQRPEPFPPRRSSTLTFFSFRPPPVSAA